MTIEIGSSDAPVVCGVSQHETPWHLWSRLVGLVPTVDAPDEVMKSGKRLEDYVLDMECEEAGLEPGFVERQSTRHHREREWQRATPDGWLESTETITLFEIKCLVGHPPPVPRVADVVQCLHQLLVFEDAEHVRLIYFGALRRERFIIPRHQAAMDRVLREEEAFLRLVETETPPPVRAEDGPGLWRGWPLVADRVVMLPVEADAWDQQAVEARRSRDEQDYLLEEARAKIRAAMGDAAGGVTPSGVRYTWTADKRGIRTLRRKEG